MSHRHNGCLPLISQYSNNQASCPFLKLSPEKKPSDSALRCSDKKEQPTSAPSDAPALWKELSPRPALHRTDHETEMRSMDRQNYTVGWICALKTELVAACELLDEEYPPLPSISSHDSNTYTLGRMGDHHVVIGCLPKSRYGIASAATVAKDMLRSFESIRIGLMVGIGGGSAEQEARHQTWRRGGRMSSGKDRGNSSLQLWQGRARQGV